MFLSLRTTIRSLYFAFQLTLQFEYFLALRNVVPINQIQQLKVICEWAEKPNRVAVLVVPHRPIFRIVFSMSLFFLFTNKNVVPRLCVRRTPTVLKGNIFQAGYFNSLRFYENSDEYGCVKFTFALSRKPRAWLYHHETASALRCEKINFSNAPSTNV